MSVKMGGLDLTGDPKGSETILMEEIWEKILMKLTDPSDVLNAGKTCVQFQRILHAKMVETNLTQTLPFLMKYMDGESVLKCRFVSKGWRDVVDKFLENHFLEGTERDKKLVPFRNADRFCSLYGFGIKVYENKNSNTLVYCHNSDPELFIREMKDHKRNPFVGRAVWMGLWKTYYDEESSEEEAEEEEEDRKLFPTLYNFFETFGNHIWTLHLSLYVHQGPLFGDEEERLFPFILRDLFELAPNLKKLHIDGVPDNCPIRMRENEIRALAPPAALEKFETSSQFPCIDTRSIGTKAILLRLSNSQLRVLHIDELDQLQNLNLPNLKELHFTNHKTELDVIFRNLRLPKLELLSITLGLGSGDNVWNSEYYEAWRQSGQMNAFMNFFPAINHLSSSSPNLKTLRFETTCLWDKESSQLVGFPEGQPCPENIKTLEIPEEIIYHYCTITKFKSEYANKTSDYSFLLRFPHVENIHISMGSMKKVRSGPAFDNEIVEVHKFMYCGRMYESNIWKLLPKLKVFSYGEWVYTRSTYEGRLAKGKVQIQE